MALHDVLQNRRAEILEVAARYGATSVRVFGSVARGGDDENSDIDFLVELQPGRSLLDLGGLLSELRELLGRPVDVVTVRGWKERILERVLAEAISL